jgi:hypothetical protein
MTRVPGLMDAIFEVKSPSSLTVIRNEFPSGDADSENG